MIHSAFRALTAIAVSACAIATRADFPPVFNTEPDSVTSQMSAEDAAAQMELPRGFRATAFASEPDVQNPIAMSWDARGRLWVAENYTYAEREQRFALNLRDRVVILDNTNGDSFQTRKVFTDNVQMLTGVEVGHDGVWLMCPPQLIFIPDRDHDDVPDGPGEVILDGFTVAQQNYHNFANGLRFGPDGWLYGRCGGSCPGRIGLPGSPDHERHALEGGIWRYHPIRKHVEVLTTGTTNPWGHDWNSVGEAFFVNTVNGHLWHMIPGAHFTRPFTLDPNGRTYELIDFHADHWHFDTGQSWTKSRDGAANSLGGGHAHSGAMIYEGRNWPRRYRGKLFTLNFHGRRANQETLRTRGTGYVAEHNDDFMLAKDPWFRGMELSAGPDGGVFVLDWSDSGECHEHTGVHRTSGRVYKIIYGASPSHEVPSKNLQKWTPKQLAETHSDFDRWQLRQARLELARRSTTENLETAEAELRKLFLDVHSDAAVRVQSLLTLHIIGGASQGFLIEQLRDPNESVRAWAVRLLTESWTIDDALGPVWRSPDSDQQIAKEVDTIVPSLVRLAAEDNSGLVRLTLASTLQRLPTKSRISLARELVNRTEDASDHNLPLMVWYGLIPVADEHARSLVDVARDCRLPTTLQSISRCLAEEIENEPNALNELLGYAADQGGTYLTTVLAGVASGLKGWRRAPRPANWDRVIGVDEGKANRELIRELSVVFGDGRATDELKRIAMSKGKVESSVRLAALETLIQSEPDDLRAICEQLLTDSHMNVLAARGLSQFDDSSIGEKIVSRYRNFRGPFRPQIMSILVSRKSFAKAMLNAMEAGKIPREDLSPYQVRQIHSFEDSNLSERVAQIWGEVRETSEDKKLAISELKKNLDSEHSSLANLGRGRELFVKHCQNCHRLFGEGEKIGPDLTGANRNNIDYLLTNIIDPSSVVDKDYRMSVLLTDDDRIINGLITSETDKTLTLQTATELLTFEQDSIRSRKVTEKSPMPDGLLETLRPDQVRDLIGYLRHPSQVSLPTSSN
ncbi:MAG: PVC-type heme-binding CxxCH protein [Rubripirellula sp.]